MECTSIQGRLRDRCEHGNEYWICIKYGIFDYAKSCSLFVKRWSCWTAHVWTSKYGSLTYESSTNHVLIIYIIIITKHTAIYIGPNVQDGAKRTHVFFLYIYIFLQFLSLGLPQIKSLRSKTSYSRRSESFHSRRNCNCATRNVSKCDAELWGEAPDVCTARRTPSFRYNFP